MAPITYTGCSTRALPEQDICSKLPFLNSNLEYNFKGDGKSGEMETTERRLMYISFTLVAFDLKNEQRSILARSFNERFV